MSGNQQPVEDSLSDPAFPYDQVDHTGFYPREESLTELEDTLTIEVEAILRDYEVRNSTKRELHDAIARMAAERPHQIAELVLEARREAHENSSR